MRNDTFSIPELAKELNISKQALYKKLDQEPYRRYVIQSGKQKRILKSVLSAQEEPKSQPKVNQEVNQENAVNKSQSENTKEESQPGKSTESQPNEPKEPKEDINPDNIMSMLYNIIKSQEEQIKAKDKRLENLEQELIRINQSNQYLLARLQLTEVSESQAEEPQQEIIEVREEPKKKKGLFSRFRKSKPKH